MPATIQSRSELSVPDVSQADIESFHEAHFSGAAVNLFCHQFLAPGHDEPYQEHHNPEEYFDEEEYDDGLGYYPDGVKRTLTDEQIAIFRHSELEALKKEEAKPSADAPKHQASPSTTPQFTKEAAADGELTGSEDGEIESCPPKLSKREATRLKKQRARARKREKRKFNPEPKPDLRKRTWDVVEAGMDSLDYDGLEVAEDSAPNPATQRRKISYDD